MPSISGIMTSSQDQVRLVGLDQGPAPPDPSRRWHDHALALELALHKLDVDRLVIDDKNLGCGHACLEREAKRFAAEWKVQLRESLF